VLDVEHKLGYKQLLSNTIPTFGVSHAAFTNRSVHPDTLISLRAQEPMCDG
jgi:hypothetical protein